MHIGDWVDGCLGEGPGCFVIIDGGAADGRRRVRLHAALHGALHDPRVWLVVVAVGYLIVLFVISVPRAYLGWDETVYASQVSPRVPPFYFSAPRARGVTYLIAPVVAVTGSVIALRAYLAVIAGVALVVAYWPWLRVFRQAFLVPLAALLFAGLWSVMFYSTAAMPNAWTAFGAVALVGWFLRYGYDPRLRALVGVAAGLAVIALIRPPEAVWIAVPLVVAMFAIRRWRRPALYAAMVIGAGGGAAEWIVESYRRYGGPLVRLREANRAEGGLGWHPVTILYQLHALNGPAQCKPCSVDLSFVAHPQLALLKAWWLALPVLVVGGLIVAARERQVAGMAVPAACAAAVGFPYLVLFDYAAPRYLIPAYGLLAIPVARLVLWLWSAMSRLPATGLVHRGLVQLGRVLLVVGIALHLASQVVLLAQRVDRPVPTVSVIGALTRIGVNPPCLILGPDAGPIAYPMECLTATTARHSQSIRTRAGVIRAVRHRDRIAYVVHHDKPPTYLSGWRGHRIPVRGQRHPWYAFTPPGQ